MEEATSTDVQAFIQKHAVYDPKRRTYAFHGGRTISKLSVERFVLQLLQDPEHTVEWHTIVSATAELPEPQGGTDEVVPEPTKPTKPKSTPKKPSQKAKPKETPVTQDFVPEAQTLLIPDPAQNPSEGEALPTGAKGVGRRRKSETEKPAPFVVTEDNVQEYIATLTGDQQTLVRNYLQQHPKCIVSAKAGHPARVSLLGRAVMAEAAAKRWEDPAKRAALVAKMVGRQGATPKAPKAPKPPTAPKAPKKAGKNIPAEVNLDLEI